MQYAVFDTSGSLVTFLSDSFHVIPDAAVELSDELYMRMTQESDGTWMLGSDGVPTKGPRPESPPDYAALIASARYQHEIAGVAWGKYFIASDRESRNLLDQERSAVNAGLREENKGWKCLDTETGIVGFRPTTHDEILDIAATAYRYVAACFQRESDLLDLVEKGTFKEYLLEKGWPSGTP